MISSVILGSILVAFLAFAAKRLLTYLHVFQQDEYDNVRFLRWVVQRRAFDRTLSGLVLGLALIQSIFDEYEGLGAPTAILLFLFFAYRETDPRQLAKKKLVLTIRAKRIFGVALVLAALAGGCGLFVSGLWVWLIPIQLLPVLLVVANVLLQPLENHIQRKYWQEAYTRVRELQPFTVGITGSFGKTSVKHILGHILGATAPTLITPGSVNTAMGVTRIIREQLGPHHKYFVIEMGAYGPGSVARLCALTPPDMAIITAIGHAHYERFKTLETVARAKFELAEAACSRGGKVITHAEVLAFPQTREFAEANRDRFIICGGDGDEAALTIRKISQRREGLAVDIAWQGKNYTLEAPLFGANHGKNIALAFAAACTVGIAPETAVTALKSTPQIAHRLEVKAHSPGTLLIDDAYNSNPQGFVAALELLDALKQPNGRRLLVTPGIAELGDIHDSEHARLGGMAPAFADVLLAVAPERIKTFVEAFRASAHDDQEVVLCPTLAHAREWIGRHLGPGDVILLENDLPDLYESKLRL